MIWIGKERIDSAPDFLMEWVTDDTVRQYEHQDEAVAHFKGAVDHLGNLPEDGPAEGTWLRFHPTGLNILGENHEYLIAETVVTQAVGAKSFVFEGFVTEELIPGSHLHRLYYGDMLGDEVLGGLGDCLGERVESVARFGVDSMYARIGFDMAFIGPYLRGDRPMTGLGTGNYRGSPMLDGVRLAWAFAKDIADKDPQGMTTGESGVAGVVKMDAADKAELDTFVKGLRQGEYLGDSLTDAGDSLMRGLRKLTESVISALLERIVIAPVITTADQAALGSMNKHTSADQEVLFMEWRNLHIARNIAAAAERGVRYAGIGADHLKYLVQNNLIPDGSHWYDITKRGLADAVALTARLRL